MRALRNRKVMVLHKLDDETKQLAVGRTFRFPASKTRYTVLPSGQLINPDKYHERRQRRHRIVIG